jgi:AbrB family looped-hinge helix DNA binding protein
MFAIVTSKGQITIPQEIREHYHIKPGDKLDFVINDDDGTLKIIPAVSSLKSLKGVLPHPAKPVTLKNMKRVIGTGRKFDIPELLK